MTKATKALLPSVFFVLLWLVWWISSCSFENRCKVYRTAPACEPLSLFELTGKSTLPRRSTVLSGWWSLKWWVSTSR